MHTFRPACISPFLLEMPCSRCKRSNHSLQVPRACARLRRFRAFDESGESVVLRKAFRWMARNTNIRLALRKIRMLASQSIADEIHE
jgi:hypothetical protein